VRPRVSADKRFSIYTGQNGSLSRFSVAAFGIAPEYFAHKTTARMTGREWSDDERVLLWRAVSVLGRCWRNIAASALAVPGRGAVSMGKQWANICNLQDIPAPLPATLPAAAPLLTTSGAALPTSPLPLDCVLQSPRSVFSGRPWDYVVHRISAEEKAAHVRLPTERQARYIRNWSLDCARGHGYILCNLKRAEAKLRAHFTSLNPWWATVDELMWHITIGTRLRDRLGMVVYPGQGGATVTRSCAALNWVGGQSAGPGRFVCATEVAAFMGISSRLGSPCDLARRYYTDCALCGLLAKSVHSRYTHVLPTSGPPSLTR
jgi:hypothetical protein